MVQRRDAAPVMHPRKLFSERDTTSGTVPVDSPLSAKRGGYYALLAVSPHASLTIIEIAYRTLRSSAADPARGRVLDEAYATLHDPELRRSTTHRTAPARMPGRTTRGVHSGGSS
jgi:hypothetical protein